MMTTTFNGEWADISVVGKVCSVMATISDVARMAGVTRTTVSHALSGNRPVAAATRERILEAARMLNYHPNAAAQSLGARRTHTIGLSLPVMSRQRSLSTGRYFDFIASISNQLTLHGYKLLCLISQDLEADNLVTLARSGHVDGMLLLEVLLQDKRISALQSVGLPMVAIGRPRYRRGTVCLDVDIVDAARKAVRYLFGLGHQRIAFMGDLRMYGYHFRALIGYRTALRELRAPRDRSLEMLFDPAISLPQQLQPLLDRRNAITALIAVGDMHAVLASRTLAEHGYRVPDDISLLALSDSPLTALAQPPITAMQLPVSEMGSAAVNLLVNMLKNKQPDTLEHLLPLSELIVRESTRRPGPALGSLVGTASPASKLPGQGLQTGEQRGAGGS